MIVADIIRIVAQKAISGATLAGTRVYDSAISTIDELMLAEPVPVIVISTDAVETKPAARDVHHDATITMLIEAYVAQATVIPGKNASGEDVEETVVTIPHTDAGTALTVGIMSRQITRALFDQTGPWAKAFCGLCPSIVGFKIQRGGGTKDGARYAACGIEIRIAPIREPKWGEPPAEGNAFRVALDLMRTQTNLVGIADAIEGAVIGTAIPDWRLVWTQALYSDADAVAIGLGPYVAGEEPPALDEIVINDGDGTDAVINETTSDEQDPPPP